MPLSRLAHLSNSRVPPGVCLAFRTDSAEEVATPMMTVPVKAHARMLLILELRLRIGYV